MKPFVTVSLIMHGFEGESPFEISDYVDDNGRFVPLGTEVAGALERHDQLHFEYSGEYIIPYHSIVTYNITKESQEYTKPEDDFCYANPCSCTKNTGNNRKATIAPNGDGIVDERHFILVNAYEIPYLLEQGITVKFMGSEITAITNTSDDDYYQYTITTADGNEYAVEITYDSGTEAYMHPRVNGEAVDKFEYEIGTSKYFVTWRDGTDTLVSEGLYDGGAEPVVASNDGTYQSYYPTAGSQTPIPADRKYPAVTDDTWYMLTF